MGLAKSVHSSKTGPLKAELPEKEEQSGNERRKEH
jgi:hypothetical protein